MYQSELKALKLKIFVVFLTAILGAWGLSHPGLVLGDTSLNQVLPSTPPGVNVSSCTSVPPDSSPDLLQIDTASNSATLYFVPVKDPTTNYLVSYGYSQDNTGFMAAFVPDNPNWIVTHKIENLSPNTDYYFKVSALNDCASGPSSNVLSTQTLQANNSGTTTVYKGLISILNGTLQINSKGKSLVTIALPFSTDTADQNQTTPDANSKNWLINTISSIESSFNL